ncbi:MAG: hypothetical protein BroJett011_76030 [Chloroflexota bacterium]|nr:MAG: hypothetical protein BroJett011_76030 [Chloroflexota bacterium]
MPERWLNDPPPQSRKRTKDSQVTYTDLEGWVRETYRLEDRHASGDKYVIQANHLEGLPPRYIQRCACLDTLEKAARIIKEYRPPRGQRGGHFSTSILVELNNQIERVKKKGKG